MALLMEYHKNPVSRETLLNEVSGATADIRNLNLDKHIKRLSMSLGEDGGRIFSEASLVYTFT